MKAPAGAVVGLFVDLVARVAICDLIVTEAGRKYQVLAVREQLRGKHAGRQHLKVLVLPNDAKIEGDGPARVHVIRWYPRPRRKR